MPDEIRTGDRKAIDRLVEFYSTADQQAKLTSFSESLRVQLEARPGLRKLLHSTKHRIKDPAHLRDKLERKARKAAKQRIAFGLNENNIFSEINDLVGARLIHIHTRQFAEIREELLRFFGDHGYPVLEDFKARTWDDEYRMYFQSINIPYVASESMYTSVHCIIASNQQRKLTAELQVRTLSEELWGEVDHSINYPHKSEVSSCREQIRVLARVTSSATRLVDSIFHAHDDARVRRPSPSRQSVRRQRKR